ncbi:MerR family transcriptional regulator [Phytomonospora sp. NPDC050363]|uniref:MerR family transcriptional regulator n=1 Tax=Phytomonospora sp. NPDC050363 TaxID=3155642 RepID=UPI0033D80083
MTDGLTIGQAAAYAGITVKTVRHYHRLRLIGEPARDKSGYRRYTSADLLRLVQVRTLAAAGVPLAGIGDMLEAEPGAFATTLAEVEQRLTDRIDDLVERRDTLRRLADGDRALLPARATALLDLASEKGFSADDTALVRESLVLVRALAPDDFDDYLAHGERVIADPGYMALLQRSGHVAELDPDDPRVDELAADMSAHLTANPDLIPTLSGLDFRTDGAARFDLLYHYGEDQKPALARLTALIEAHLAAAGHRIPGS